MRQAYVVKPHDGKFLGNVNPLRITFAHHSQRRHVVRANHRRGDFGVRQKFLHRRDAALHRVISFHQVLRIHGQTDLSHRLHERVLPRQSRLQRQRSGNKSNFFVPQRCQMLHCLPQPVQIIDFDCADPRQRRPHVNKHQRHIARLQIIEQRLFHPERDHRHALHPAFDHPPHRKRHARGVVHRGSRQNLVIILNRDVLESLYDFWKKRIGDLRNDQAENPAASGNQRARLRVRVISQLLDHFPHAA